MRQRHFSRPAVGVFAALAAAAALSVPVVRAQTSSRQGAPRVVSAGDLLENADRYYGMRVTVTANVEDVYSRNLFTLDEDSVWTTGRDLLVLNPRPLDRAMTDQDVSVTGTMMRFSRAEIERRYDDWRWNLDKDVVMRFEQRPVLIADTIRTSAGIELVAADPLASMDYDDTLREPRIRRPMPMTPVAPVPVQPGELDDNPERYYGRTVTVRNRVDDIYSRSLFTLDDDIVVIAPEFATTLRDNRHVTVTGEVLRFDIAAIERHVRGYRVDVLPRYTDALEDRPVIIATSIRTDDGQELIGRR